MAVLKVANMLTPFANPLIIPEQNDYGLDLFCEYLQANSENPEAEYHEVPSGVPFAIQVKSGKKPYLSKKDKSYLKKLDMPVFLFWVDDEKEVWYKRVTPEIDKKKYHEFKIFNKWSFVTDFVNDYIRVKSRQGSFPTVINSNGQGVLALNVIEEELYTKEHRKIAWKHLLIFSRAFRKMGKTSIASAMLDIAMRVAPNKGVRNFIKEVEKNNAK